jgi:hypothetical protein
MSALSHRHPVIFLILASFVWGSPAAQAVHCLELFETTERTPFVLSIAEFLPEDERRLVQATEDVLDPPVVLHDEPNVSLFKSTSDANFRLYAVHGIRFREFSEWMRVDGFSRAVPPPAGPKLGLPEFAQDLGRNPNKLMPANEHAIVAVTNGVENVVRLASTETVLGAYRIENPAKPYALVVTHQQDTPIGFGARPGPFSINLYVVSDTGYQWLRFRASGRTEVPKISLVTGADYGLVLKIDERPFQVVLASPKKELPEVPVYLPDVLKALEKKQRAPEAGKPQASADLLFPMRK